MTATAFCFDNEGPRHDEYVQPVRIARSLVTNAQWLDFMADGGYATSSLWLSDGWATREAQIGTLQAIGASLMAHGVSLTLAGQPADRASCACHAR